MSIYAIADLHLSFGVDKPMDVFRGWDNYVERIENNWKKLVSVSDTVIIPGDISWGINYKEALPDLEWINSLPGKKILIKGNHDLWWDTMSKNERVKAENSLDTIEFLFGNAIEVENIAVCGTRSWFFDAEKSADKKVLLREVGRLERSIESALETGKEPVVFLHYPPITTEQECEEITATLKKYNIKRCYYGHMHSGHIKVALNGEKNGIKYKLISGDALSFCPYLIEK